MGKRIIFSINGWGQLESHKPKSVEPLPHTVCKNELKWVKDLNVRAKTIKLLEKHRHESPCPWMRFLSSDTKKVRATKE